MDHLRKLSGLRPVRFLPLLISTLVLAVLAAVSTVPGLAHSNLPKNGAAINLSSASPDATPDPLGGTFTTTGSLNTGRNSASVALLNDGRVLVAGGAAATGSTNAAEIYDPTMGTFTNTGNMIVDRASAAAVTLLNGKVLVVGGQSDTFGVQNTAELFDPTGNSNAGSFTAVAATMNKTRQELTATLLNDGRVLVVGGIESTGNYLANAEIFDPAGNSGAGSFGPLIAMSQSRARHTATLLSDGRVLVAGGFCAVMGVNTCVGQAEDISEAEIFDPTLNSGAGGFVVTGSMLNPHEEHAAALLPDGKVLIVGDFDPAEIFDPSAGGGVGVFSSAGTLNVSRSQNSADLLPNGLVLVAGGTDANTESSLASAEIFDPSLAGTMTAFTLTGSMNEARTAFSAVTLSNGQVLVLGGEDNTLDVPNIFLTTAEIYHFTGTPIPSPTATATGATATATPTPTLTVTATPTPIPFGSIEILNTLGKPLKSIKFRPVPIGIPPAPTASFVVENNPKATTTLAGSIAATQSSPFQFAGGVFDLAPGATATFTVTFVPISAKQPKTELTILSSDPKHQKKPVMLPLTGVGEAGKFKLVKSVTLSTAVGAPLPKAISALNIGKGVITGSVDSPIAGLKSPPGTAFTVTAGSGAFSVSPGGMLNFTIQFAPPAASKKPYTATLPITINGGTTIKLKLTGKVLI